MKISERVWYVQRQIEIGKREDFLKWDGKCSWKIIGDCYPNSINILLDANLLSYQTSYRFKITKQMGFQLIIGIA